MSRSFHPRLGRHQPDEVQKVTVLPPQRTRTIVQTSSAGARARTNSKGEPLSQLEELSESSRREINRNLRHHSVEHGDLGPDGNHCAMCGRPYSDTVEFGDLKGWVRSEAQAFLPCGHHFGASCLKKFLKTATDHSYRCPMGSCLPVQHRCHHVAIPILQVPDRVDLDPGTGLTELPFQCEFCNTPQMMKAALEEDEHFAQSVDTERSKANRKYHELRWRMKGKKFSLGYYIFKQKRFAKAKFYAFEHLLNVVMFRPWKSKGKGKTVESSDEDPEKRGEGFESE